MKHARTARFWARVAALFACEVGVIVACALLVVLALPAEEREGVRGKLDVAGPAVAYGGMLEPEAINRIDRATLNELDRATLKASLGFARALQEHVALDFQL